MSRGLGSISLLLYIEGGRFVSNMMACAWKDKIESGGALGELWLAVHLVDILLNVCLDT